MEQAINACLQWGKNGDLVKVDMNSEMRLKIDQINSIDPGNPIQQEEILIENKTTRICTNEIATKQVLGKEFNIKAIAKQPITEKEFKSQDFAIEKYFQY
jgi:hypothetical protein